MIQINCQNIRITMNVVKNLIIIVNYQINKLFENKAFENTYFIQNRLGS